MVLTIVALLCAGVLRVKQAYDSWPHELVIMHEGRSGRVIHTIAGVYNHLAYPYRDFLLMLISKYRILPIKLLFYMNVIISGINVVLFSLLVILLLKRYWLLVAIFIYSFATDIRFFNTAFSETVGPLINLYLFIGILVIVSYEFIAQKRPLSFIERSIPLALVLAICILLHVTRDEMMIITIPIAIFALLKLFNKENKLTEIIEYLKKIAINYPVHVLISTAIIIGIISFIFRLFEYIDFRLLMVAMATRVWKLNIMSALIVHYASSNLCMMVLCMLGLAYSLWHWRKHWGLPIILLILTSIYYFAAIYTYYEFFRYTSTIMALYYFLGLYGTRMLEYFPSLRRGDRLNPYLYGALVLMLFADQPYGFFEYHLRNDYIGEYTGYSIKRNMQIEAKFIVKCIEKYPYATFISVVNRSDTRTDIEKNRDNWNILVFNSQNLESYSLDYGLQKLIDELDAGELLFLKPADAYLQNTVDYERFHKNFVLMDSEKFPNMPYNNAIEYGAHKPEITLALYRIR